MPTLFPELKLVVFAHIDNLVTLIRSACVSREWRALIEAADIDPIRRRYLQIYREYVAHPNFLPTHTSIGAYAHSVPFNREAFLLVCHPPHIPLPPELEMWILEWPGKASGPFWPGCEEQMRLHKDLRIQVKGKITDTIPARLPQVHIDPPSSTLVLYSRHFAVRLCHLGEEERGRGLGTRGRRCVL